jgi:C4-dicarboxylate-specific signal transduction histidine kinase
MVGHILHEGRKPVGYLRNTLPDLENAISKIEKNPEDKKSINLLKTEVPYLKDQTELIHVLFSKLDPFTYKKNERAAPHTLQSIVQKSLKLFKRDLEEKQVELRLDVKDSAVVYGRATDLGWIFSNIFENSLFWLSQGDIGERHISIKAIERDSYQNIEVIDSGPGTTAELLEDGKLFEPGISLKKGGTGMGLALVGELVKRNKGEVWSPAFKNGMKICLRLPAKKELSDES